MKLLSPLILLSVIASTTNAAICCYYSAACTKRDALAAPIPLEERYYSAEEFVADGAVNIFKRYEPLGTRAVAGSKCCCLAANQNACVKNCSVSNPQSWFKYHRVATDFVLVVDTLGKTWST